MHYGKRNPIDINENDFHKNEKLIIYVSEWEEGIALH